MPVLKYYDGSDWEPVVSALQGPTGDPGAVYQDGEPTDTGVLWVDTDDDGFLVVPNGGVTGSVLTKQSSADYDTGWNLPTSPGLVHIETRTVTASSAESFNDVFSTTYDNYKIIMRLQNASGTVRQSLRLRVSGTDASGSDYRWRQLEVSAGGVLNSADATANKYEYGFTTDVANEINSFDITIFGPFLTKQTNFIGNSYYRNGNAQYNIYGAHTLLNSYTGFTLLPASSNISGDVSIFGYAKA